jgi:nucleoside-diphosphate-sugar epimerase
MRALVTGGTGYLGRAVVRAFAAAGHETVVVSRSASKSGVAASTIDGDVRDLNAIDRAAADCDVICHLAALVAIWRPRSADFDDVNVGGLRNVLEVSARRGVKTIYTSSFLALPPRGRTAPLMANDYQRTKVLAEREAAGAVAAGASLVRLYPGVLYGPGVRSEGNLVGRLVDDHLSGRLPGIIGAEGIWSCAWVEDVAHAHVAAAERAAPGTTYSLGGENLPQMQIFEAIEAITGRRKPMRIPVSAANALGAFEELRARIFGASPLVTRGAVEIFTHDWPLDSAAAVRELGYKVRPLVEGIDLLLKSRGVEGSGDR